MVGDSTWDCEAAKRAGVETVAVLTGGFSEQELRDAGAVRSFRVDRGPARGIDRRRSALSSAPDRLTWRTSSALQGQAGLRDHARARRRTTRTVPGDGRASWSRSTTPATSTGTCGSSTTERSPRGRSRVACPTTRTRTGWRSTRRTTRSSTSSSRARSRRASTAPGPCEIWDSGTYEAEKFRDDEVIADLPRRAAAAAATPCSAPAARTGSSTAWTRRPTRATSRCPSGIAPMQARARHPARATRSASASRSSGTGSARSPTATTATSTPPGPQLHRLHPALPGAARAARGAWARSGWSSTARWWPSTSRAGPASSGCSQRMHLASESAVRRRMRDLPVTYVIFDLLYLDGHYTLSPALRGAPRRCSSGSSSRVPRGARPPTTRGEGSALLDATRQMGVEGVVAKRLDSPYEPGRRSSGWIKVKNVHRAGRGDRRLDARRGRPQAASLGALAVGVMDGGGCATRARWARASPSPRWRRSKRELEPLRARRLAVRRPPAAEGHRVRGAARSWPRWSSANGPRRDPARALLQGPSLRQGPARLHP